MSFFPRSATPRWLRFTCAATAMSFTWTFVLSTPIIALAQGTAKRTKSSAPKPLAPWKPGKRIPLPASLKQNLTPLFPFGHGLSYTTFSYSKLKSVSSADGGLDVSLTLRNTGNADGDEVVQVYLGPPPANGAQFAMKALASFDRVRVKAGQSKNVTLHVPLRGVQYWSTTQSKWVTAAGSRALYVAASSRDVRLTGSVGAGAKN